MLVSLSKPNPIAARARAVRGLAECSAPVRLDHVDQEVLDERLGDVLRGARKVGQAAVKRAKALKQKAAQKLRDLFKRRDKKRAGKLQTPAETASEPADTPDSSTAEAVSV